MDNDIDSILRQFLDYLQSNNLGRSKREELIDRLDILETWVDKRGPLPRWPIDITENRYHDLKVPRHEGESIFRAECIALLSRMHTALDLEHRECFSRTVRYFKSWCIRALDE